MIPTHFLFSLFMRFPKYSRKRSSTNARIATPINTPAMNEMISMLWFNRCLCPKDSEKRESVLGVCCWNYTFLFILLPDHVAIVVLTDHGCRS